MNVSSLVRYMATVTFPERLFEVACEGVASKPCKIDGCEKPTKGRGWCVMHLRRWEKYGDTGPVGRLVAERVPAQRTAESILCSIEGCEKVARNRGWCSAHYERNRLKGDPGSAEDGRKREPKLCEVPECEQKRASVLGYCGKHLNRYRTYGNPLVLTRESYGSYRRVSDDGYVYLYMPGHPLAIPPGYVAEHRLVMWDAGLLTVPDPNLHVHHINEVKTDNRLENLQVMTASDHHKHHIEEAGLVTNQFGVWPLRRER